MVRFKPWQWVVLAMPVATIVGFLMVAAGWQIHEWGINWIWGIVILVLVGWRWLLVRWTRPMVEQMETLMAEVGEELESATDNVTSPADEAMKAEAALQESIKAAQNDPPVWEDWQTFWQRCQELVVAIAHIYHPEVKYPLLNIYVPQAYGLIRGTVDDVDRWMQKLSPVLNQVTVRQAYQAYETYRKLEPSARKLWRVWNWAQWLLNPAVAVAKQASQRNAQQANQQLIGNLGQLLREAALRNLCGQAIALYGGSIPAVETPTTPLPEVKTQTIQEILAQAEPAEAVEQKPVNLLLVGRTGAGKSSLINTLFKAEQAEVDVLPSTDTIQNYHWQTSIDSLTLWDTPGYEQIEQEEFRELVLDYATTADLLLLVTPALDPALQMDVDFLKDIKAEVALNVIAVVTQVDRLRPLREWEPPYNWQSGDRPKEINIREAVEYRAQQLGDFCEQVLPVVTNDFNRRADWGVNALSVAIMEAISPAKQLRLARFLRHREARSIAAAKTIDHYTLQMSTTQGLTALLKSPVLGFISTLSTGSPTLAYLLAEKIPVEQLPVVIGKLQMAYDLFSLLNPDEHRLLDEAEDTAVKRRSRFDLLALWPLLLENPASPDRNAWAFGHALIEYWTENLTIEQLRRRFNDYLQQA